MTGRAIGTRLAIAQSRAEAARARLSGTLETLQHRATPQVLVHDIAESLKERSIDAVLHLAGTAKRRPAHVGLLVALVGLFLARNQIARLLRGNRQSAAPVKPSRQGSAK